MVTYNWNCRTVDAYVEQNEEADVVYNVHWIVTGVSDIENPNSPNTFYQSTSIGTQVLDTSAIVNFIPFADVTNEEVVTWTQDAMGAEQVTAIETGIASQIESKIHPTTVTLTVGDPVPYDPIPPAE